MNDHSLIPKKSWKGVKSNEEILTILQHSDALIMGSIWPENAPLVISEAHAVGCPVIAPRIGGIPELIENQENGLLYEAGNIKDLAKKIAKISFPKFDSRPPLHSENVQTYIELYKTLL